MYTKTAKAFLATSEELGLRKAKMSICREHLKHLQKEIKELNKNGRLDILVFLTERALYQMEEKNV